MPVYNSATAVPAIYPGDIATVASADTIVSATASQQVNIGFSGRSGVPALAIEGVFSAAPSSFSFTVQSADTDAEANYVNDPSIAAITTVDATNQNFRVLISPAVGRFFRLKYGTKPTNAVTFTGRFARLT